MISTIRYLWPEESLKIAAGSRGISGPCPMCVSGAFTGNDRMTIYIHKQTVICRNCGVHPLDDTILAAVMAKYRPISDQSAT